jgi:SAM-dependent methyltransferase
MQSEQPPSGKRPPGKKSHWERIYSEKETSDVSWYQAHPEYSLAMIEVTGAGIEADIIDVGGGASTLVDHLLAAGYRHLCVLDISPTAIARARERLGIRANKVSWLECDITDYAPGQRFDIWHDRAVFHFLTTAEERSRYLDALKAALKPGGHAIIATFAENGPAESSGLEVVCYNPESLSNAVGEGLHLVETRLERHRTPHGGIEEFVYCRFRRDPTDPAKIS